MHIFRHILTRIPKNQNFFHKTLKNQKIIPAYNEQGSMKRGEKWFSELVLRRGGLPSKIALPGEASSPKLCIEGWVRTLKSKKIFLAYNEQGSIKRG